MFSNLGKQQIERSITHLGVV